MSKAPVLRATRRDWMTTGIITAVCAIAVGGAYFTADIREASLVTAAEPVTGDVQVLAQAPNALTEAYAVGNVGVAGEHKPLVSKGLLITNDERTVRAMANDGTEVWSYTRENDEICALGTAWDKVVVTYRTGVGCGDVVSIDSATGQYADTRSAINSDDVVSVTSNDRVGTVSTERLDLWRSDMVRTVEYGDVEAKQEPDMQPNEACTMSSALTRTENVALTESCPDAEGSTWLRLMKATPEDSRKPEIQANVHIQADGVRLVAVGQEAAAVYMPGATPQIRAFNQSGEQVSESNVAEAPAITEATTPFAPATADLPHHMTWFDGERLYLFTPTTLSVDRIFEDAIGTPVAVGERMLMPVKEGIAVVDWSNGNVDRVIKVDRGSYSGPVYLAMAGTTIVESRGDQTVAFTAS
ncbi:hypothetical protein [uncultured Corynebacterium sp.]|uniref:Rv3212 family protein n=1 Tax=uncultured Corynebacterium sp. TaxID=159447 RepID=UPI0025F92254|nr:hypothetical protein [uncultured Corynebacterium sp.]